MKHNWILLTIVMFTCLSAYASTDPQQNEQSSQAAWGMNDSYKAEFDLESVASGGALCKTSGIGFDGEEVKNMYSAATLIQGGYFTLGTTNGVSASPLDDHCGITFGHPYALTSYPLLAIDGQWGKLSDFFDVFQNSPVLQHDTLSLTYDNNKQFRYTCTIAIHPISATISLSSTITNLSAADHTIGQGLVFDAGLGKKGDGWAMLNENIVRQDTMLINPAPTQLLLHERSGQTEGMKTTLDLSSANVAKVVVDNWREIYADDSPAFTSSFPNGIYDTAIKLIGGQQTLAPGKSITQIVTVTILQPDFGATAFMRWDLPAFLSIENNLLFPRQFASTVEITSATSGSTNCTLELSCPDMLSGIPTSANVNLTGNSALYQTINFSSKEILEDQVVALTLNLKRNSEVLDSIVRQVFIPAIPIADTGLVCSIDTVISSRYPSVQLSFDAQNEETGQWLFSLQPENVFLYENEARIHTFTFANDTTGGFSKADVVFVLDCSGSMGDDIQKVRSNINEFADSLLARGIDLKVGVVAFSTTVDDVHDLTSDINQFKNWLNEIANHLWGGDENSLAALWRATELTFRPNSKRSFVWITDENYSLPPVINLSVQQVVNRLLQNEVTVYSISETSLQTTWCNPIIEPTGGKFFNIYGNFRDILMEISRIKSSNKFMISYSSPNTAPGTNNITLELHYAGLGGFGYANYQVGGLQKHVMNALSCFPNPFNPTIQIITNLNEQVQGELHIYNVLGQEVMSLPLNNMQQRQTVNWNARDMFGQPVAAGTYFVRLEAMNANGALAFSEMKKILYLK
jgi:Mg-chelatase subunit ChlD